MIHTRIRRIENVSRSNQINNLAKCCQGWRRATLTESETETEAENEITIATATATESETCDFGWEIYCMQRTILMRIQI